MTVAIQHGFENNPIKQDDNDKINPYTEQVFDQQINYDSFSLPYSCCDIGYYALLQFRMRRISVIVAFNCPYLL